jgi:predicted membrane protein DUF2232
MTQVILIGVGAGAAAAFMFGSVTSGVGLSVILFYLAPLPIMIVALGWSHWAGLTAAMAAAALLGGAFGIFFFATFLASVGAPAWWLGYLALLGRSVANGGAPHMEWYPPGRLVLWAAAIGAAVVVGALATFGGDEATIRHGLSGALEQILRLQTGAPEDAPLQLPGIQDAERVVEMLVSMLPPAAAVIAAVTLTGNLWLAGLVVRLSGRLRRPWPDLNALSFPLLAVALYGALLAGAFLPGLAGLVASVFAATLTAGFAMIGFAVLHTATRHMRARAVVLSAAYGCVTLLIWPVVIMTLVGVAETLFGLRVRLSRRGPPATRNT